MNFDWRKLDLRKANIFDLTDDIEMIHQCTCCRWIESMDDRDEYVRKARKNEIPMDMISFAYWVEDKDLYAELHKIFAKEIEEELTPPPGTGWE